MWGSPQLMDRKCIFFDSLGKIYYKLPGHFFLTRADPKMVHKVRIPEGMKDFSDEIGSFPL